MAKRVCPMDVRVGDRVAEMRAYRRLTQEQLASCSRISITTLHRIETGDGAITVGLLDRIAKSLDTPITWFMEKGD